MDLRDYELHIREPGKPEVLIRLSIASIREAERELQDELQKCERGAKGYVQVLDISSREYRRKRKYLFREGV